MSRAILMPDGSYKFVNKGIPPDPELFPGFEVDPKDQYHLIPKFPPCKFRKYKQEKLKCGKILNLYSCTLKSMLISAPFCQLCREVKRAVIEPKIPEDQFEVFQI